MALPQLPTAFFVGGNTPTEKAILSVLEAQVRKELTSDKATMYMRGTATASQIAEMAGVAMAVYRVTVRVL